MFPFKRFGKNKKDKQTPEMSQHNMSFDNTATSCENQVSGLGKESKQEKDVWKKEVGKRLFNKKTPVHKNNKAAVPTDSNSPSDIGFETKQVKALKPGEFSNKDTKDKLFRKLYAKRRHSVADIPSFVGCRSEEENRFESKPFDPLKYRYVTSKKNVKGKIFSKIRDCRRHSVTVVADTVISKTEQERKLESKRLDVLKRNVTSKKSPDQKSLGNIRDGRRHSEGTIGRRSSVALENEVMTRERRLLDIAQLDRYIAYLQANPSTDGLSRLCCAQLLRTVYTRQERNYLNAHNRLQGQGHHRRSLSSPVETKRLTMKDRGEEEREEKEEESGEDEGEGEFYHNGRVKDSDCSSSASASTCIDDDDDDDDGDIDNRDDGSFTGDHGKSRTGRRQSVTKAVYPQNFEIF